MGVEFSRSNAAIDAFHTAMKSAADRRAQDVALERDQQRLDEDRQSAPFRISRVQADSRLATTAADVADATKGANIRIQYNTADQGALRNQDMTLELGEKRATSPSRIESTIATNEANRDQAPIATQKSRLDLSERVQTSPDRVQQSRNATIVSGAQATDASLKFLRESIKLLDEGKMAEADEVARRAGDQIPDRIKNDAAVRRVVKDAIDDAERWYPNRPAAQKKHVEVMVKEALSKGGQNVKPSDRAEPVLGQPAPSEAGTSKNPTALQQNTDFLIQRGIAKDAKDAFRMLNQSKTDYQSTIKELYKEERKRRLEVAKGPGGFTQIDNETLNRIDNESMNAAVSTAKQLRQIADEAGIIATPAASSLAAQPGPVAPLQQPAPTPAPAPAPAAAEKPAWWEIWKRAPEAGKSGVPSIKEFQAPPKTQERAPGGEPPPPVPNAPAPPPAGSGNIEELRRRASGASREQILEEARAYIPRKGREAVIQQLLAIGVDPTGL